MSNTLPLRYTALRYTAPYKKHALSHLQMSVILSGTMSNTLPLRYTAPYKTHARSHLQMSVTYHVYYLLCTRL